MFHFSISVYIIRFRSIFVVRIDYVTHVDPVPCLLDRIGVYWTESVSIGPNGVLPDPK